MVEFALGYGCHVANDEVGHHKNGFLNPSADHEIEVNLDARFVHEQGDPFLSKDINTSEDMIDLILKTAKSHGHTSPTIINEKNFYHTEKSSTRNLRRVGGKVGGDDTIIGFPRNLPSKQQILPNPLNSIPVSAQAVDYAHIKSSFQHFETLIATERIMLRFVTPVLYKFELKRHSFCEVASYEEVVCNFNLSQEWATKTCKKWIEIMWELDNIVEVDELGIDHGSQVDAALQELHEFVDNLFESNGCNSCCSK